MKFIERKKKSDFFVNDIQGGIVSSRLSSEQLEPFLDESFLIDNVTPTELPDMKNAIKVLHNVRRNDGLVVCVVDYDADGICSGAVLQEGLSCLGVNVGIMVTDRYADGYGFSDGACKKILGMEQLPDVLITADLGSSDGERFTRLQNECEKRGHKIEIIVTDHHHISKENPPVGVEAFINPHREDVFNIFEYSPCGAGVAWLLIKAFSSELNVSFNPYDLIDFVGVATIGDMVSLIDPLNRVIVKMALQKMNDVSCRRMVWSVLLEKTNSVEIDEGTIGFKIAPRINALSRMGDNGEYALEWLTSGEFETVSAAFTNLDINNEERKEEQLNCQREALKQASLQVEKGAFVCVCYVPNYTHGVVGLASSHIVTELGVPAVVFSGKDDGSLSGSARSIPGFDIRGAFEAVQEKTGLFSKYGGHTMAAGGSLRSVKYIDKLRVAINDYAKNTFEGQQPEPIYYHDGILPKELKTIEGFYKLRELAPFGQEFPAPSFLIKGMVDSIRLMGADKNHARITLLSGEEIIWFKHEGRVDDLLLKVVEVVVSISKNTWRNKSNIQLILEAVKVC